MELPPSDLLFHIKQYKMLSKLTRPKVKTLKYFLQSRNNTNSPQLHSYHITAWTQNVHSQYNSG